MKFKHCQTYHAVLNVDNPTILKPAKGREFLKYEYLYFGECAKCKSSLYGWEGLDKQGRLSGFFTQIRARKFESDWLPRLKTDVVQPPKSDEIIFFVGEATIKMSRDHSKRIA